MKVVPDWRAASEIDRNRVTVTIVGMTRFALLALVVVAACSSSPANVAGDYSVALTNRANGCNFQNWTVDATTQGVSVTITQQDADATATVNGVAGGYLDVVLGGHAFAGTVDGDDVDLTLFGTRSGTMGNCTYTFNAIMHGTLAGDALSGTIDYAAKTNGNPDCAPIEGCATVQEFAGVRPPT